jgi:hypothetical protein
MSLTNKIQNQLRSLFQSAGDQQIPIVCDWAEDLLMKLGALAVLEKIQNFSKNREQRFVAIEGSHFIIGGRPYVIHFSEHASRVGVLLVTVRFTGLGGERIQRRHTKIRIDGLGRVTEIQLRLTESLLDCSDSVSQALKVVFETGYRCLLEYVRSALSALHKQTSEDLYSLLREILPKKVVDEVWLCVISKNKGLYIPSTLNRESAFRIALRRTFPLSQSPMKSVAEFSTRLLNFDDMFSKKILPEGKARAVRLPLANYSQTGFQLAEQQIYQSEMLVTHPLVFEGETWMVAGYPVRIREKVEEVLEENKARIKDVLDNRAKTIRGIVEQIRKQGTFSRLNVKYFEMGGAFLKGLFGLPGPT